MNHSHACIYPNNSRNHCASANVNYPRESELKILTLLESFERRILKCKIDLEPFSFNINSFSTGYLGKYETDVNV